MTTDELNAIIKAVMDELEKAGVDFDFKAETPQATDLVYVMRGTADKYQGITVKWQNLLDIIVKKATDAKNEAVSAKDIALQTLATIQSIESNVSTMKSSVETTKGEVETLKSDVTAMKASVETSEANVTQMKSDVSEMKTSVEGTKTEVEGLLGTKADVTYVDGELAKKVNYSDSLSYENIIANNIDLTGKVASAEALKHLKPITGSLYLSKVAHNTSLAYLEGANVTIPANCIFGINAGMSWDVKMPTFVMLSDTSSSTNPKNLASTSNTGNNNLIACSYVSFTSSATTFYVWGKNDSGDGFSYVTVNYWYIQL